MKSIYLLLCAIISFLPVVAQLPKKASICIEAERQVSGNVFYINITDMGNRMRLVYKTRDSISLRADADTNLMAYRKTAMAVTHFSITNDTIMLMLKKLDSVMQHYAYYSMDSITIRKKKNRGYAALFKEILSAPFDTLQQTTINRNRIVLDGTHFIFLLYHNGYSRKVYAKSPTATSHPLLFALVKSSIELFRLKRPLRKLLF